MRRIAGCGRRAGRSGIARTTPKLDASSRSSGPRRRRACSVSKMTAYDAVNALWPETLPPITRDEARRAAAKLMRHFDNNTSGRWVRRCWIATKPTNPSLYRGRLRGWHRLVHDVSHRVWQRESPASRRHHRFHAELEQEMVQYVLTSGWLAGTLKTQSRAAPSSPDQKRARLLTAVKRWESKRKRAETALKKLRRRVRYYDARSATQEGIEHATPPRFREL